MVVPLVVSLTSYVINSSSISSIFFLVAVLLVLLTSVACSRYRYSKTLPPGPRGFPILGVLPLMGSRPHITVQRWWQQYGDVISVYMGSRLVLIVSGVEAMKECFIRQADTFSGRPDNYFKRVTKGKGLVFSEGDTWREHRRFTISCLKDFGMGKVVLQRSVHDEIGYLIRSLESVTSCEPVDPGPWMSRAVANIICSIIYGTRFDYDDETFRDNVYCLNDSTRNQTLINLVNFIPSLEFLPTLFPTERMLKRNMARRAKYATVQINERQDTTIDVNNPRDYIEAYLARMISLHGQGQQTTFDESQLHRAIQDLFIAGTESVSTTLKWAVLFMTIHEDIQLKVQKEIDSVVVRSRLPSMADRVSLPFTEATLMECQRLGNVALFNVPRCTVADTTVNGYHVPRGTWVFANRWGVHSSTRYWTNPTKFDPTRFLDDQGRIVRQEALLPFGMGPRSCLGESLAKMELFSFFSCLLQSFTFHLPPGMDSTQVNLEPKSGLTLCPHPYKILVAKRS